MEAYVKTSWSDLSEKIKDLYIEKMCNRMRYYRKGQLRRIFDVGNPVMNYGKEISISQDSRELMDILLKNYL